MLSVTAYFSALSTPGLLSSLNQKLCVPRTQQDVFIPFDNALLFHLGKLGTVKSNKETGSSFWSLWKLCLGGEILRNWRTLCVGYFVQTNACALNKLMVHVKNAFNNSNPLQFFIGLTPVVDKSVVCWASYSFHLIGWYRLNSNAWPLLICIFWKIIQGELLNSPLLTLFNCLVAMLETHALNLNPLQCGKTEGKFWKSNWYDLEIKQRVWNLPAG